MPRPRFLTCRDIAVFIFALDSGWKPPRGLCRIRTSAFAMKPRAKHSFAFSELHKISCQCLVSADALICFCGLTPLSSSTSTSLVSEPQPQTCKRGVLAERGGVANSEELCCSNPSSVKAGSFESRSNVFVMPRALTTVSILSRSTCSPWTPNVKFIMGVHDWKSKGVLATWWILKCPGTKMRPSVGKRDRPTSCKSVALPELSTPPTATSLPCSTVMVAFAMRGWGAPRYRKFTPSRDNCSVSHAGIDLDFCRASESLAALVLRALAFRDSS
mmetsp:Transcript_148367/g.413319  ORF Transcript_148367/g.413319 Transcript_148367/m.413319 type:complete len:273 (+) Transcript_148367:175-993(+)